MKGADWSSRPQFPVDPVRARDVASRAVPGYRGNNAERNRASLSRLRGAPPARCRRPPARGPGLSGPRAPGPVHPRLAGRLPPARLPSRIPGRSLLPRPERPRPGRIHGRRPVAGQLSPHRAQLELRGGRTGVPGRIGPRRHRAHPQRAERLPPGSGRRTAGLHEPRAARPGGRHLFRRRGRGRAARAGPSPAPRLSRRHGQGLAAQ